MLILTEKPSVAKDFAAALSCTLSNGAYRNNSTVITNCVGHLFKEESPAHYGTGFPFIPSHWDYCLPDDAKLAQQAKFVVSLLRQHKSDTIIIATDADREGEIIARECLLQAGISDFARIKRFWVSQALTREVITEGLKCAKPLSEYNILAEQGFARQHADWLVGMNFCRYISTAAGTKLSVGRVQTAILSAIEERCNKIKNFVSEKYFEHYGIFQPSNDGSEVSCRGIFFEEDETGFSDNSRSGKLNACVGKKAKVINNKIEKKIQNPPQLYNLNAVQKDAFKLFGYSADKTLKIVQSLYEELKCVSYPRTPSRVMGSGNVELCKKLLDALTADTPFLKKVIRPQMDISLANKRCFNDAKLEAHHALIPLKPLPANASEEQANTYKLIYNRFLTAFLPPCEYEKQTYILEVGSNTFKTTGRTILKSGWKELNTNNDIQSEETEDSNSDNELDTEQNLKNIDWNNLVLAGIETKEKWTKPPAYFNEASILSFMENPKYVTLSAGEPSNVGSKKLVGLGTAATRHTFIPILIRRGYITLEKKNFICTPLGSTLLDAVRKSAIKSLADISATTDWEEKLDKNPGKFLDDIKTFVKDSVSKNVKIEVSLPPTSRISCPVCGKEIRKGKSNWYCTGYKNGCKFILWENIAGAKLTEKDITALCSGKKTGLKHCTSKNGKAFDCRLELDEGKQVRFSFGENKRK